MYFDSIIYLPRELGDVLFAKSGHLFGGCEVYERLRDIYDYFNCC